MALFRFVDLNDIKFDLEDKDIPFMTIDTSRVVDLRYNYKKLEQWEIDTGNYFYTFETLYGYRKFLSIIYQDNMFIEDIVEVKNPSGRVVPMRITCTLRLLDDEHEYKLLKKDYLQLSELLYNDTCHSYTDVNVHISGQSDDAIDIREYIHRKFDILRKSELKENRECYRAIKILIKEAKQCNIIDESDEIITKGFLGMDYNDFLRKIYNITLELKENDPKAAYDRMIAHAFKEKYNRPRNSTDNK